MPEYDDTNRFTLFKNDKQGNEARPDYTGSINVDGRELKLSAWIKKSNDGTKTFMSGAVQEPYNAQQPAQPAQTAPQASDFDDDSSIPF